MIVYCFASNIPSRDFNFFNFFTITKIQQIGFRGWTKQVYEKSFKCIMAKIKEKTDIDAGTIYRGGEPMYKLIETYRGPLARLKDK